MMGKPVAAASLATAAPKPGTSSGPQTMTPRLGSRDPAAEVRERPVVEDAPTLQCPGNASVNAARVRRTAHDDGPEVTRWHEGLTVGQVQVDRTRRCSRGRGHRPADDAAHVGLRQLAIVRERQLGIPLGEAAEQMVLVDGLRRTAVA